MNPPTTAQRLLLLDANVVIEAHRLSAWQTLVARGDLAVSSIVAHEEALFYDSELGGVPSPIHLPALIAEEKIVELSATPEEMKAVLGIFDRVFAEGLHAGEVEALGLLRGGRYQLQFCSGDQVAIQALAMLDRAEDGISLEAVLKRSGLSKAPRHEFTERFFSRHLKIGHRKRITGEGLRR